MAKFREVIEFAHQNSEPFYRTQFQCDIIGRVQMSMSEGVLWNSQHRHYGWIVLASSRRELRLSISPCIAGAYAILHRYFRSTHVKSRRPYLLLTTSLFLSCKTADAYRSLAAVFRAIAGCIVQLQSRVGYDTIQETFGCRDFSDSVITPGEIAEVSSIELDFLNAIDWNPKIQLPFDYFAEIRGQLSDLTSVLGGDAMCRILHSVLRNICVILCDERYLDLPPSVSAAAAVQHGLREIPIPPKIGKWINEQRCRCPSAFTCAMNIVTHQPSCL